MRFLCKSGVFPLFDRALQAALNTPSKKKVRKNAVFSLRATQLFLILHTVGSETTPPKNPLNP